MSVLTDPTTYPISSATARQLDRPLFGHVIDGELVPSLDGGTMPVVDPATGEQVATAASGSPADVERAVQSAREAFDDGRWRYLAPLEQERRLRKLAALLADHEDELANLDVIDSGLLRMYAGFIVQFAVDGTRLLLGLAEQAARHDPRRPERVRRPADSRAGRRRRIVVPWNGPTAAAAFGLFPLCAGNSVVLKPAEQTPMTRRGRRRARTRGGDPAGRVQRRPGHGRDRRGGVVAHPQVDVISFTGSVDTGRAIQAPAASRVKRVCLELGGKSPSIIFRRRRPRCGSARRDDGRMGRLGSGVHVQHARPGP